MVPRGEDEPMSPWAMYPGIPGCGNLERRRNAFRNSLARDISNLFKFRHLFPNVQFPTPYRTWPNLVKSTLLCRILSNVGKYFKVIGNLCHILPNLDRSSLLRNLASCRIYSNLVEFR